jgi:hypothetical protein
VSAGRIVCWFSCGVASAVATKLAIAQFPNREIVIARCIVQEEHPDNDRFASDCAAWFGRPIVNLINEQFDGSIYAVFSKRGYISGLGGAPCTMLLKKRVREDFQRPDDVHVFGYCAEEQDRWDSFIDSNNIESVSPLIDRGLQHSDCLSMVASAGISIPAMYRLGYQHNNCIGCAKATGAGYWNKVRVDFPLQFQRMATLSRSLGVRMTRDGSERIFLDELRPGTGNYQTEPEIQCGIFCHMAQAEISQASKIGVLV